MGRGERGPGGPGMPGDDKGDKPVSKDGEEDIVWGDDSRFDYTPSGKAVSLEPDALDPDVTGVYWGPEKAGLDSKKERKKLYQAGQFVPYGHTSLYGSLSNTQDREDNALFQEHLSAGWITLTDDGFVLEEGAARYFNAILERRSRAIRKPPGAPEGGAGRKDVRPVVEAKEKYKEGNEVSKINTPFGDLVKFDMSDRETRKLVRDGMLRVVGDKYYLTSQGADYFNQQHQHAQEIRRARLAAKFGVALNRRSLSSAASRIPDFGRVEEIEEGFEARIAQEIERQFNTLRRSDEKLIDILERKGYVLKITEVKGKKDNKVTHYRVQIRYDRRLAERYEKKRKYKVNLVEEKEGHNNMVVNINAKRLSRDIEESLMSELLARSGLFGK